MIRYSLRNQGIVPSRGTTPDVKKVKFVNHENYQNPQRPLRVEGVKSTYLRAQPEFREQIVRSSGAPMLGKVSYVAPQVRRVNAEPVRVVRNQPIQRNPQGHSFLETIPPNLFIIRQFVDTILYLKSLQNSMGFILTANLKFLKLQTFNLET